MNDGNVNEPVKNQELADEDLERVAGGAGFSVSGDDEGCIPNPLKNLLPHVPQPGSGILKGI